MPTTLAVVSHPVSSVVIGVKRRALNPDKVRQLAQSIQRLGLLNPLTITSEGLLVAGLHRLEACKSLGWEEVPASIVTLDALCAELAEIDENLIRNELSELEQAVQLARRKEIYLVMYPETKAGKSQANGMNKILGNNVAEATSATFAADTAEKTGVTDRTIRTKVQIGEALGEVADDLMGTPVADSQKDLLALARMEEEERAEIVGKLKTGDAKNVKEAKGQVKRERRAAIPPDLPTASKRYRLIQCGVEQACSQAKEGSVDCIITDPPYPEEYLPLYGALARLAAQVLKPGGSLLCMVGQSYLPEILTLMVPHLRYQWMVAYLTPGGQSSQLWQRKVNTFWKPVLWFVKGEYRGGWIGDVTRSKPNDNDKRFHHWGQSESGMADLVERFTLPGQTVLDPFLGGGTTGVVSVALNRLFVGMDIDEQAIKVSASRLLEVPHE